MQRKNFLGYLGLAVVSLILLVGSIFLARYDWNNKTLKCIDKPIGESKKTVLPQEKSKIVKPSNTAQNKNVEIDVEKLDNIDKLQLFIKTAKKSAEEIQKLSKKIFKDGKIEFPVEIDGSGNGKNIVVENVSENIVKNIEENILNIEEFLKKLNVKKVIN